MAKTVIHKRESRTSVACGAESFAGWDADWDRVTCRACLDLRRGPGRPPIDPEGETDSVRVRLAQSHRSELEAVARDRGAKGLGEAVRLLIEDSAARRK